MLTNPQEEIALPIKGKKRKLDADILIDYFGRHRLGLSNKIISAAVNDALKAVPAWENLVAVSFLSDSMKTKYLQLLNSRKEKLFG